MVNAILELEGVKKLSKNEQKSINGGRRCTQDDADPVVLYSPDTTAGPNAGEPKAVAITCSYTCRNTFLGIGVGSTYTVWGGC